MTRVIRSVWFPVLSAALTFAAAQRSAPPVPNAPSAAPSIDSEAHRISFTSGASLRFPKTWTVSRTLSNAVELAKLTRKDGVTVRSILFQERCRDHEDALQRLQSIAASRDELPSFLGIAGWPALQRTYTGPLAEPDRDSPNIIGDSSPAPVEKLLATYISTAIAAGDVIFRIETTVAPGAPGADLREAQLVPLQAVLPRRLDSSATAAELAALRAAKPAQPPTVVPSPNPPSPRTLRRLPPFLPPPAPEASALASVVPGSSETAAAVSSAGVVLFVASNGGVTVSNDSGATFASPTTPPSVPAGSFLLGDPSLALGRSGNTYFSTIAALSPSASPTALCSDAIFTSGNAGATFSLTGNAVSCPQTGAGACLPDQPMISADQINAARPGGGDQVYAVWRNISLMGAAPVTPCAISGSIAAMISCSNNAASTWSTPQVIGAGDFPRLTVGSDGFVYVILRDGIFARVHKFSSCSALAPLEEQSNFPTIVSASLPVTCPIAGLDRCNASINLPTLAVDDTNPNHVYAAAVQPTPGPAGTDNIFVFDSVDGGLNWRSPVQVNSAVSGRRFLPWMCAAAGDAYVGWFDRRAAAAPGAASNDLTDYFLGSVSQRNGLLVPGREKNLTNAPDPECGHWSFFGGPDSATDSSSCSVQPQLAGTCSTTPITPMNSFAKCNLSSPSCPNPGETCNTGKGAPVYGDYNGIACSSDRILSTWVSSTAPSGFTGAAPSGPTIFSDIEKINPNLFISQTTVPVADPGTFSILVDGATLAASVANTTVGPFPQILGTHHKVSDVSALGTPSGYATSIGGDCDSDGTVHFSALHPATCSITNVNPGFAGCLDLCGLRQSACMLTTVFGSDQGECVRDFLACNDNCSHASLQITKSIVPSLDSGRFDLLLDGTVVLQNVGNGASTGDKVVAAGLHTVTENAVPGTTLSNYTTTFSGDCNAGGQASAGVALNTDCIVTNTRKPGTGADAQLTVKMVVTDLGRFDVLIDGSVVSTALGNGGTAGPVVVLEGSHIVTEGPGPTQYSRSYSGACNANGSVVLLPGQSRTCTITNQRVSAPCLAACTAAEGKCMAFTHDSHDRQECIAETRACDKTCQ